MFATPFALEALISARAMVTGRVTSNCLTAEISSRRRSQRARRGGTAPSSGCASQENSSGAFC
jgi:hypothetical protein